MPSSLKIGALAAAVALAAALTSCSTGGGSPSSSAVSSSPASASTLKQQAQREHGLVIYANAPAQYFQPVIARFNKRYPFIKVSVTTLTPAGLSAFPSWVNQGNGVYVMSAEPALLVYNPKLLNPSEVPKTWAQLAADAKANPGKYKLVSYPISNPLNYGGIYGLIHVLGAGKVWAYYDAMAPETKTFNEGLDALTQIIQGGASVGYMSSGLAQGILPHYKGLASYTFLQDATPLIPRGIAVSKDAASPASARLFLDFLYTQAGQVALCAGGSEATMNNFHPAGGCTASLTALQSLETDAAAPAEIGVMLLVSAEDQQTATAISKLANPLLLHLPLPTMGYLPSFAFATSPALIDRGAAYEFVLNHVVDVDSPVGLFRLEMEPSHD